MQGNPQMRYSLDDAPSSASATSSDELEQLRQENDQLRTLCADLEAALHEATQGNPDLAAYDERLREYETLIDEKNDTIRRLHQQLEEAEAAQQREDVPTSARRTAGPLPQEDELLRLSEELEAERRQLQEDEATLMEQMRQMEMSMAKERAEMARQRNDLQRLNGEIRHELERLEKNGALQSKMDELKEKLKDASTRKGAAPTPVGKPASSAALPNANTQPPSGKPASGILGRFLGGK
jgi:chromosome segregation ATPase